MKFRHSVVLLPALLLVAVSWMAFTQHGDAQSSPNITNCPSGIGITKPFNSQTVSGPMTLEATAASSFAVHAVTFVLNDQLFFTGQPTDQYWRATVDSAGPGLGNGSYNLKAKVDMYDTANNTSTIYSCYTPSVSFAIQNPTAQTSVSTTKTLVVVPSITSWTGPTNVPFEIVMKAGIQYGATTTDVTQQATYDWATTKGVLTPQGYHATLNSGPASGSGSVTVHVTYGSLAKDVTIPLNIQSASTATTYPTAVKPDGTTTATTNSDTADKPATVQQSQSTGLFQTALSTSGQGDAELERCLSTTLGEEQYLAYIKEQKRMGFSDIKKSEQCFLRRSSMVPANLAPVEPSKVPQLPVSGDTKLRKIEHITRNNKDALSFSGTARPNQTVVIYVFSEPLVLVAKADANGTWTYVLEDPMQPGDHHAYVTVEGDNQRPVVRSDSFGFAVVSAPKSKLNPLGLSYAVKQADKPKLFLWTYVAAAVLLIGLAVSGSLLFMRRRARRTAAGEVTAVDSSPITVTGSLDEPAATEATADNDNQPKPPGIS